MKCSKKAGHGVQDLATATANSCNPAFINIGLSIGTSTYYQYMKDFGLMQTTGVDLQGEAVGVAASEKNFKTIDLASYAFGQNFTVTPLQLIAAQAACINGGYLYTPYVVDRVMDEDGNVISQHDATPVRQVVSEETSATVRAILESVVANGTGRNGQVAGYAIGGKTGTADQGKTGNVVVSFLCFAPADDPQIIMLLTLDTPARDTDTYPSGGAMVAPMSGAIMSEILPYLGINPTFSAEELQGADTAVPNVVGLSIAEAKSRLSGKGFACRVVGDGEKVTDQTPVGGIAIPGKSTVVIYAGEEKPDAPCTVPALVGKTPSEANVAATNAGLFLRFTGTTASTSGTIRVLSQSEDVGAKVPAGTVITVQLGDTSVTD
jgi:stage V sporulation protein D (sporulation-specific penicillin-binding protein)